MGNLRGNGSRDVSRNLGLYVVAMTAVCCVGLIAVVGTTHVAKQAISARNPGMRTALRHLDELPLRFEANAGQTDSRVKFLARTGDYTLFLTPSEAVLALHGGESAKSKIDSRRGGRVREAAAQSAALRIKLAGSNGSPHVTGLDELPGISNYFIGNDPKKWHAGVPSYSRVAYSNVYPGIDMMYYGSEGRLESDFMLEPGANPRAIALGIDGAKRISINDDGDLLLATSIGSVTLVRPTIYQIQNGERKLVQGSYALRGAHEVGFNIATYNANEALVIDPALGYSTYLGGSFTDTGEGIAVDSQGNAYITGSTTSADFPTVPGSFQTTAPNAINAAFVTKINPGGGALVYSTYLGGTTIGTPQTPQNAEDAASAIAVDANGVAYITGFTASTDFPITVGKAFQTTLGTGATFNAFVTQISADGTSLLYSTYLGGQKDDEAFGIAVDASQNAYVTGSTTSNGGAFPVGFPTTTGAFQTTFSGTVSDAFVSRIDTTRSGNNSLVYSTFLAGTSAAALGDAGFGIAVDANKKAYVTGQTTSTDFPKSTNPFQGTGIANGDAFFSVIDTTAAGAASLFYSTYIGGTSTTTDTNGIGDGGNAVVLDAANPPKAYVAGFTTSADFPKTIGPSNSANGKAFVAKFDATQGGIASLIYSTLIGGTGGDTGSSIGVDSNGIAYLGGSTGSADFPVTPGALQSARKNSVSNGFVTKLSADASTILYSTYFSGTNATSGDSLHAIALDNANSPNAYITGRAASADLITTAGSFQPALKGTSNAFVAKLTPDFSIAGPANGVTVQQGKTAQFIVTVTPINGSTQTVNITCTGAPALSTCTPAAPGSVTLNGNTASMVPVTVTTTKGSLDVPGGIPTEPWKPISPILLTAAALLALVVLRRRRVRLAWVGLIFLCALLANCGGGKRGTPKGTTNLTITGTPTQGTAHSTNVSLTVN